MNWCDWIRFASYVDIIQIKERKSPFFFAWKRYWHSAAVGNNLRTRKVWLMQASLLGRYGIKSFDGTRVLHPFPFSRGRKNKKISLRCDRHHKMTWIFAIEKTLRNASHSTSRARKSKEELFLVLFPLFLSYPTAINVEFLYRLISTIIKQHSTGMTSTDCSLLYTLKWSLEVNATVNI